MFRLSNALRAAAGACAVALVGGCGIQGLQDQYTADVAFSENTNKQRITMPGSMRTFDLLYDCMPADTVDGQCPTPTMVKHFSQPTGQGYVLWRDRFQDYLLWRSDQQCERHKASILATQSVGNFALSTITTGASAVAAIAVAPAASILSAIAAISSGTKSAFNEDFYRQFVGPAVVRRINFDRADMYAVIMARRGVPVEATPQRTVTERVAAPGTTAETRAADIKDAASKKTEAKAAQDALDQAKKNEASKQTEVKSISDKLGSEKDEEKKKALTKQLEEAKAAGDKASAEVKAAAEKATSAKKAETDAASKVEGHFVTRTYSAPQERQYEIDYQGERRHTPFRDYTVEAAIQDVERYHQLCSFVSGLASLVQPGAKFEDTELGIRQRIANLTAQLEKNNATAKALGVTSLAGQNLLQVNTDITRQIMFLQQKLATAPMNNRAASD